MEASEGFDIDEKAVGMDKTELDKVPLDHFEIVRRQYLSHIKDNLLTIKPDGIQFNNACIARMVGVCYIYILIDRTKKRLLITACHEDDRDGQQWCNVKDGVRKSRKLRGRPLGDMLYDMMGWCKGYAYRVCGSPALAADDENRLVMVFELNEAVELPMTRKQRATVGVEPEDLTKEQEEKLDSIETERNSAKESGRKATYSRLGVRYPEQWDNDAFGVTAAEHVARPELPTWDNTKDSVISNDLFSLSRLHNGQSGAQISG